MEVNDEVVERQKLVEVETEEDLTSAPKSAATPASPVPVPKIKVLEFNTIHTHMYIGHK